MIGEHFPMSDVFARAKEKQVAHLLCVAVDLPGFDAIETLAQTHSQVSASAGVHPNEAPGQSVDWELLRQQISSAQVVAIGETGLDYFRSSGELTWQQERFREHIRLAREFAKPLIIHMREAKEDVIRILREEGADSVGGVMHCFVEDLETAHQAMELNFYISISGIVSFKNAQALQEVVREIPLERLLIETDSPYLAPSPYRGKINQPAYVYYVAEKIAQLKNIPVETVAEHTTHNFSALTGVNIPG